MSKVSGLTSRLFGLWTLLASLIRLQAAYNIHDRQCVVLRFRHLGSTASDPAYYFRSYNMAVTTFGIVVAHYLSEWLVYKSTKLSAALISPMIVGCTFLAPLCFFWLLLSEDQLLFYGTMPPADARLGLVMRQQRCLSPGLCCSTTTTFAIDCCSSHT